MVCDILVKSRVKKREDNIVMKKETIILGSEDAIEERNAIRFVESESARVSSELLKFTMVS